MTDGVEPQTDLVTVLIPARDEERGIDACLTSILEQRDARLQVVVVDNGSTDRTADLVRARARHDSRIVLVHQPEPSIPATLNAGLAAAEGTWLVRVDAHSTIPPGYVARAVEILRSGSWVGVGGRKDAVASTRTGKAIAAVLGSRLAVGGSTYHHGTEAQVVDHIPFGVYPTALLKQLGGWDETVLNNEDFELDQRLRQHGDLWFDPTLRIAWHCRETLGGLYAQYRRYGTGKPAVALAHPASIKLRHLAPPALVVWLASAAVVSLRSPRLGALALAPYAAVVTLASVSIARSLDDVRCAPRVPAALVAMQVGWGAGFWVGASRLVAERLRP